MTRARNEDGGYVAVERWPCAFGRRSGGRSGGLDVRCGEAVHAVGRVWSAKNGAFGFPRIGWDALAGASREVKESRFEWLIQAKQATW